MNALRCLLLLTLAGCAAAPRAALTAPPREATVSAPPAPRPTAPIAWADPPSLEAAWPGEVRGSVDGHEVTLGDVSLVRTGNGRRWMLVLKPRGSSAPVFTLQLDAAGHVGVVATGRGQSLGTLELSRGGSTEYVSGIVATYALELRSLEPGECVSGLEMGARVGLASLRVVVTARDPSGAVRDSYVSGESAAVPVLCAYGAL